MQPIVSLEHGILFFRYADPQQYIKLYPPDPVFEWSVFVSGARYGPSAIIYNNDCPVEFLHLIAGCVADGFSQPIMDWCQERDDVFQFLFADPDKFIALWRSEIRRA